MMRFGLKAAAVGLILAVGHAVRQQVGSSSSHKANQIREIFSPVLVPAEPHGPRYLPIPNAGIVRSRDLQDATGLPVRAHHQNLQREREEPGPIRHPRWSLASFGVRSTPEGDRRQARHEIPTLPATGISLQGLANVGSSRRPCASAA
ncbi:unnamed protein product [Ectocarpus sp. 8 AP-2014]